MRALADTNTVRDGKRRFPCNKGASPFWLILFLTAGCAGLLEGAPPAPDPLLPAAAASAVESFRLRCAQPGVLRCVSLDDAGQAPNLPDGRGPMGLLYTGAASGAPRVDCEVAASGCSLRFTVPSRSGPGAPGSWFLNFSDNFSASFGEGEEFYVQWRQRFSPAFLERGIRGDGWKQAIIGEGDRPGYAPDGKVVWSCTQLELVVQNNYMRGYPQMYHSCGGKDGNYEPLQTAAQIEYRPDEWMTFQVRVRIGTWYRNDRNYHRDSEVELWVAREGERSRRAVVARGYDLANTSPHARYGKLWLLPYHSNKDDSQAHAAGHTWYDEVIVSRAPVPDP